MQRNYNLLVIFAMPVVALVTRVFYWGRVYNFLEHLALNAFEVSVIMVAYFVMLPSIVLWPVTNLTFLVLTLVHQAWFYRQVLGPSWVRAIATTLVVAIVYLGWMTLVGSWLSSMF